ncbi:NAD(P)-binding protein [Lindgomyces ingoldianus]|uniref:NAD(P)-binding protein n=1 Tax=Lindgomyces ingoldianus TaxID=673940 RepID=A0ACB6RBW8_9PLEO|nr:NAD(P)-binding protein [Lindgomyces ingoldianus]KAF2476759.1 NAD(P)-binding protein [Lindgomyces ingoldianus]
MGPSKSMQMGPLSISRWDLFYKSQFKTKVPSPPVPPSTSLTGQTAIVTGSNTGLGFYACKHLLSLNLSRLIIAVRSKSKGETAANELRKQYTGKIEVWELDMSSYDSIRDFVRRVESELERLDIAILNAGVGRLKFTLNPSTGHEESIQTNYLSTFLLSILLLPALKNKSPAGKPGHLTLINSAMGYWAKFPNRTQVPLLASFDDEKITPWDPQERYAVSKALGHLFFPRLAEYVSADDVVMNMVEPGFIKGSNLQRDAKGTMRVAVGIFAGLTGRRVQDGAWTHVDAVAVKGKESHGCFLMNWGVLPFNEMVYTEEGKVIMDRLWDETMLEFAFAGVDGILKDMKNE